MEEGAMETERERRLRGSKRKRAISVMEGAKFIYDSRSRSHFLQESSPNYICTHGTGSGWSDHRARTTIWFRDRSFTFMCKSDDAFVSHSVSS